MKLTLDREDLRPEHYFRDTSKIDFRHFTKEVMKAIITASGAVFRRDSNCYVEIKVKFPYKKEIND